MAVRQLLLFAVSLAFAVGAEQPNIVWIIAEDASPHIGAYGETSIRTPNLDRMAAEGVRFANAFVTNPVCSPSRSAMVSGMYQTTLGAHNHRSANTSPKAGGNEAYYDSYRVPESIRLIPELFREAGYFVVNGGKGKTDYNFLPRTDLYQGKDWSGRAEGQPFFAQIQLPGGKNRRAKVTPMTDPARVVLPPYYPDHPVLREDWARYLNSWVYTDRQVGEVLARLKDEGVLETTVVFFWTDHGLSHVRGKQFLYEEGIRVPLIARLPGRKLAGSVRKDLVSHIDVAAASLDLAGMPIPDYVQGRPLFSSDHDVREQVFSARDRCDETVEAMRSVRTARFKYIRNFRYHRSHMQPNRYKDGKEIVQTMFSLHEAGKLNPLQDRVFARERPFEELYDVENDPFETQNLAGKREHLTTVRRLRESLYGWMVRTRDMGLVPEPILEDLGKEYRTKYDAMGHPDQGGLVGELLRVTEAGARDKVPELLDGLESPRPSVRYWAAIGLGNTGRAADVDILEGFLEDTSATVRIAAALSLARHYEHEEALAILAREIENPNLVVGLYAIRAIEELGDRAEAAAPAVRAALDSPYDTTRRVARRLAARWALVTTSRE